LRKPTRLPLEQLAPYQLDLIWAKPNVPPPRPDEVRPPAQGLNWAELFGNSNPVELEVGFGKGLYLVRAGERNPDRNYLGIEIVRKYQLFATTRIALRQLPNVKTACADAKRVLSLYVLTGTLDAVHVYFPDPWWKNRHKKRLLFTPEFAAEITRTLKPGGILHFATDVSDYFDWVSGTLATTAGLQPCEPPREVAPEHDMDYLTNFERKFRLEGRPIYRSRHQRTN
jgi:tRNA (guanine-N7-)-methyltransferase